MRIFFVSASPASFVMRDVRILRERHDVQTRIQGLQNPLHWLVDLPSLLGSHVAFFWFASLYNLPYFLLAVLFGKRIVTIVGGYEAANRPDLNYGNARGGIRTALTKLMLRASTRVLAVSEFSRREVCENLGLEADKVQLIYHGFEDLAENGRPAREELVLNIGSVNKITWKKKGIEAFVKVAESLPTRRFVQVGGLAAKPEQLWGAPLPKNVEFVGQVPFAELPQYFMRAKVYLQLSEHESFGCSVAEAMLFEMLPIVANAGALPEVVGACGRLVEPGDIRSAADAVTWGFDADADEGRRARDRVLQEFSYQKRRDELLKVIEEMRKPRRKFGGSA